MKLFFSIAAGFTFVLGVGWLFFPAILLAGFGVEAEALAIYIGRRSGVLFLGYAVILWLGRTSTASPARTAILAGGLVVSVVMAAVSLVGIFTGIVGPALWIAVVVESLLAAGFAYYYATAG